MNFGGGRPRSDSRESLPSPNAKKLSPLEELSLILDRLDNRIQKARESYLLSILPEPAPSPSPVPVQLGLGARLFGRRASAISTAPPQEQNTKTQAVPVVQSQSPNVSRDRSQSPSNLRNNKDPVADFIPFKSENDGDGVHLLDKFVEDLRRVAELCIIGENYITSVEKRKEEAFRKEQEKWAQARDALLQADESERQTESDKEDLEGDERMQLFDLFFEKNGLEMIVNLLNGRSFSFTESEKSEIRGDKPNAGQSVVNSGEQSSNSETDPTPDKQSSAQYATQPVDDEPDHPCNIIMIPPLPIAIQAVQSISLVITNVSRATSLYVLLSNNHINQLIDLPLNLYTVAERRRQIKNKEYHQMPSETTGQSVTELISHFVTFLKSLAMRMNTQTLQFYLRYPVDAGAERTEKKRAKRPARRSKSTDGAIRDGLILPIARSVSSDGMKGLNITSARRGNRVRSKSSSRELNTETSTSEDYEDDFSIESGNLFNTTIDAQLLERDVVFAKVEFPLYERALEFCDTRHDSFIRVTAMNICLNTLRLTTVVADEEELSSHDVRPDKTTSPDGVLHNAQALPFRERLAMAQFTCIPSRVERLVSPIFTKLAQRWNAVEEQIRNIDANKHMGFPDDHNSLEVSLRGYNDQGKEKILQKKLLQTFRDRVADLQDELFMLDDVFRVGLTVLNEQCIEMMLATFVYPLLLQPLQDYYNEVTAAVDESRFSFTDHPLGGVGVDLSDINKALLPVSGRAKAALVTIGCVFQCLSNRPLLRLLFTALLHPLSPDSSKAPTVRGKLEVAVIDCEGRKCIRLDHPPHGNNSLIPNSRVTYAFGTTPTDRRRSKTETDICDRDGEACVFVLAPALAEILEYRGRDTVMMSRCRPNVYQRALLKCLSVPDDMSDVRDLATCTFDSLVSVFDGHFVADILFGADLNRDDNGAEVQGFLDPAKEAETTSGYHNQQQNLSLQNSAFAESDLVNMVVGALINASIFAKRVAQSDWKLGYDSVGVHAVLTVIRRNTQAMTTASKMTKERWRKAAKILAEKPNSGLMPMGGIEVTIPGAPTINDPDYDEKMFLSFVYHVFFDSTDNLGREIAEEQIVQFKDMLKSGTLAGYSTVISTGSNSENLISRVGTFLAEEGEIEGRKKTGPFLSSLTYERREGVIAFLKLDALSKFLEELVEKDGAAIRDCRLSGTAINVDGSVVESREPAFANDILLPLTYEMTTILFQLGSGGIALPAPLSVIDLASHEVLPCVCEAPASAAHLFADDVSGVVVEGVTWQSLYIVFVDEFLVFAQPVPGQGSVGRVISSCGLAEVSVQNDPGPVQQGGPARRLLLSHKWFDKTPPPLFLFDTLPEPAQEYPPFIQVKTYVSRLDVWFEHQRASDHAYNTITDRIFQTKLQRGSRVLTFLNGAGN